MTRWFGCPPFLTVKMTPSPLGLTERKADSLAVIDNLEAVPRIATSMGFHPEVEKLLTKHLFPRLFRGIRPTLWELLSPSPENPQPPDPGPHQSATHKSMIPHISASIGGSIIILAAATLSTNAAPPNATPETAPVTRTQPGDDNSPGDSSCDDPGQWTVDPKTNQGGWSPPDPSGQCKRLHCNCKKKGNCKPKKHPPKMTDPGGGPKGNNGVGNGVDPQPPGNPPINDGPGTGPGNPGNRGGHKDDSPTGGTTPGTPGNTDDSGTGGSEVTNPKGNNGLGNGQDPPPPGNQPVNDGTGTEPGNPGNSDKSNKSNR